MPNKPFYLFIDTSAYLKSKLDFSDVIYTKLRSLINENKVYALSSSIIIRELRSNVSKKIKCDYEKIKNCLTKCDNISFNTSNELNSLMQIPELNSFLDKNLNDLDDNLNKLITEKLDHKTISVDDILDDYFEENPPFSEKKKDEFPDAIVLNTLLSKIGDNECHIISADPDWKFFCNLHENLILYDSIGSFLHYCNNQGIAISSELNLLIQNKDTEIIRDIEEQIKNHDFLVSDPANISDPELTLEDVNEIIISDYNLINIDEKQKECIFEITCKASLSFSVVGDDYSTAMRDSETDSWYFIDTIEEDIDWDEDFKLQVKASYTYNAEHKLDLNIDEISAIPNIYISLEDPDYPYK